MQTSETTSHLIGGAKVPSTGEEGIEVLNPAMCDQIGYIPAGTAEDAKAAVAAAREALPGWSRLPAAERAALVTGNTVVFKPSEKTPLSAVWLTAMFDDLPEGVLNLLLGDARAGWPLVSHEDADLVLFTGSVPTGREILEVAGRQLNKAVVELGGKDPMIVDAGVDPAWAAGEAATGSFANTGQICTSVERIYVHKAVADEFLRKLTARSKALRVGDGSEPGTEMGPLIDEGQRELVHRHVREAVEAGAVLWHGGEVPEGPGFFYPPTVLQGVHKGMSVVDEETFGPVAAVEVVSSFDEALEKANETGYGLAATVLTPHPEHAQRASRELRVGTVKVNAVFGGAPGGAAEPRKASGLGFGYGPELLDEVRADRASDHRPAVHGGQRSRHGRGRGRGGTGTFLHAHAGAAVRPGAP